MSKPPTLDELTITRRKVPPYWWPDANVMMQFFLAGAIVYIVVFILQRLFGEAALKIDPSVRDLVVFILGIVFSNFKDVYGYSFGSSAGQKRQGEVITKSLEDKDKIIADNVATTAAIATAPSADALKAATAVAPLAAAAAAPPAAEAAAPPAAEAAAPAAAEKAVADALNNQKDTTQ